MDATKSKLIQKTINKYKKVYLCGGYTSLMDCFTRKEEIINLWFSTEDNSTHIISYRVECG